MSMCCPLTYLLSSFVFFSIFISSLPCVFQEKMNRRMKTNDYQNGPHSPLSSVSSMVVQV